MPWKSVVILLVKLWKPDCGARARHLEGGFEVSIIKYGTRKGRGL